MTPSSDLPEDVPLRSASAASAPPTSVRLADRQRELVAALEGRRRSAELYLGALRVLADTLRPNMPEAREVVERWEEFTQYLCLGLSQDLGRTVTAPRPRAATTAGILDSHLKRLADTGVLETVLRVPAAVGDIRLQADLRAKRTLTSVDVEAPAEGRPKSRVNWLLRQLNAAPDELRIDVAFPNARQTTSELLGTVREDPELLLYPQDSTRAPRSFRLTLGRQMGQKRGKEEGSSVRETRLQTFDFYRDLVQNLKPWQARAPKLRDPSHDVSSAPSSDPPPFESDDRLPGEATGTPPPRPAASSSDDPGPGDGIPRSQAQAGSGFSRRRRP